MKLIIFLLSFVMNLSLVELNESGEKVVMIVNLLRHGARAPNKFIKEIEHLFPGLIPGKLTLNGFRQMTNLGRAMRKIYLENHRNSTSLRNFLDEKNIKNEYLLISSPYDRAIESGIGYAYGFLPNNEFNIIDFTDMNRNYDSKSLYHKKDPSILSEISSEENVYNFMIEDKNRDVLFHSKKCEYPPHVYTHEKMQKNFSFLLEEEKALVYEFYRKSMNVTFANITQELFSDKVARSLYVLMRCANANSKNKIFEIPKHIKTSLEKLFGKYLYTVRTNNENITKISTSPFFDHLVNFFDHKFFNIDKIENKFLNFWKLKELNYTNLKLVTYSGHDYNFIGIFKNLLHPKTLEKYLNDVEKYRDFVVFPFASNLDFHLIKNLRDGKFYVRIFVNGKEILEKVRSGVFDENRNESEIDYDMTTGLEYKNFRRIINSRIFEKYDECMHTTKKKKNKEMKVHK